MRKHKLLSCLLAVCLAAGLAVPAVAAAQPAAVDPWEVDEPNGGSAAATANPGEFLLKSATVTSGSGDSGMFDGPYVKYDTLGISVDPTNGFAMSVELKAPAVADAQLFEWSFGVNDTDGNRATEVIYTFQKSSGTVKLEAVGGRRPSVATAIREDVSFVLRAEFYKNSGGELAVRCFVDGTLVNDVSPLPNDSGAAVDFADVAGPRYGWLCNATVTAGILAKLPTAAALPAPAPTPETEYTLTFRTGAGGGVAVARGASTGFQPAGASLIITSSDAVYVKLTPNAGYKIDTARLTYAGGSTADVLTPAQRTGTASLPVGKTGDRTLTVTFASASTGAGTYVPPGGGSTTTTGETTAPSALDEAKALSDLQDSGKSKVEFEVLPQAIVDDKIFAAAEKAQKEMVFAVVDNSGTLLYQWEFDGGQITLPQMSMSLGIQLSGLKDKGNELLGTLADSEKGLVLSFRHAGQLPGPAKVTLNVADSFADGLKLNYYYYNSSAKRLELVAEGLTVSEGRVTLPQAHCSEYLLTTEKIASAVAVNPQTGDSNPALGWMAALLLAAGGLLALLRKRTSGS